ncbi:MAG TPA: hypothetical protein VM165_00095 [Planctomycetaceae bacterium]|nr:hypothetical protein [Planctomycetaceae bacterium]
MNPAQRIGSPPNGRTGRNMESIQQRVAQVPQQMTECVEERPLASVCAAFGVGLIAGVGLVALYCQTQHQQTTYESLAQRVTDAIRNSLPQQLSSFRP